MGLTLVELLVVIGILALLAAVLFPVFQTARENGRMAVCISNLHQWGAAIQMYRDEWGGVDPEPGRKIRNFSELGMPPSSYTGFLKAYGLASIGRCPSITPYSGGYYSCFRAQDDQNSQDLDALATKQGRFPLVICIAHNRLQRAEDNPTWGTVRVLAVRLNQQVTSTQAPAYGKSMVYW